MGGNLKQETLRNSPSQEPTTTSPPYPLPQPCQLLLCTSRAQTLELGSGSLYHPQAQGAPLTSTRSSHLELPQVEREQRAILSSLLTNN